MSGHGSARIRDRTHSVPHGVLVHSLSRQVHASSVSLDIIFTWFLLSVPPADLTTLSRHSVAATCSLAIRSETAPWQGGRHAISETSILLCPTGCYHLTDG